MKSNLTSKAVAVCLLLGSTGFAGAEELRSSAAESSIASAEAAAPAGETVYTVLPPRRPGNVTTARARAPRKPVAVVADISAPATVRVVENRTAATKPTFWMTVGNGF